MKVVFYIGHHKVGSTALQVYLSQNWLRLAQAGILYPAVEMRGFANNLGKALGNGDEAAELPVNIREPHSALAYRMMSEVSNRRVPEQFRKLPAPVQMFEALRAQLRWIRPRAVVLCSEAFSNFGEVRPDLIDRLCSAFPDAEFEVYCALRRPDEYLVSWHGQRLKVGERVAPLSDGGTQPYFSHIHFNYRMAVEAWTRRVPGVRLMIRNYSDILAAGGSTEDFTAQVGIDFPGGMIPASRANKSLPRAGLEIVRRANHELEPAQAQALRQYLLEADDLDPIPARDIEMFGAELRAEMAERFAPIHAWLSELTGQEAFFPDIDEMMKSCPVPEREAVADLLAQIDRSRLPAGRVREFIDLLRRDYDV